MFSIVFIVIIAGLWMWVFKPTNPTLESTQNPVNREQFEAKSSAFAEAETLIDTNPTLAKALYELAAADASIQGEVEQIHFGIANATFLSGNKVEGIKLMKAIVASSTTQRITRAYAIQFMLNYLNNSADSEVFTLVFSDEPYASFSRIAKGVPREAMKQLAKYGLSFYPLPILNLRLAAIENEYYAKLVNEIPVNQTSVDGSKTVIMDSLVAAERSIDTLLDTNNADQLPQIYNLKGLVLANMVRAGDSSLGNPVEAFEQSLQYEKQFPNSTAKLFTLFNYVLFLSSTKYSGNEAKVNELVEQITITSQTNSSLTNYIANLRKFDSSVYGTEIQQLAELNPNFKEILINAGWAL